VKLLLAQRVGPQASVNTLTEIGGVIRVGGGELRFVVAAGGVDSAVKAALERRTPY
jgi:hypothetical protein